MKKFLLAGIILAVGFFAFAGDAAAFNDIGFSKDGKTYIFGQYGKTDRKYQPYAEIYTIDVERNEYVSGQVYKVLENNTIHSGKQVYENLYAKHQEEIKKYDCSSAKPDDVLYICENEKKKGIDEIIFRNFIGEASGDDGIVYKVHLVPTYYGRGIDSKSSFYIDLDMVDQAGGVRAKYKIGSPDIKRKGVVDYKIVQIIRNKNKTGLIFVVEKTIEDATGTSVRYMVETVKL